MLPIDLVARAPSEEILVVPSIPESPTFTSPHACAFPYQISTATVPFVPLLCAPGVLHDSQSGVIFDLKIFEFGLWVV